ncbi:MAG: 3-dehydroquinate synthase [Syntrophales bacterium]
MKKIKVNLDRKKTLTYEICIGRDILDRVGPIMTKNNWASRYIIITDSNVADLYGGRVLSSLREIGIGAEMISFAAGETSKNFENMLNIVEGLIAMGADRKCGLIALGGGVVGDIAGFIASIFMRSVPYVQIPTTLLAMVDSSIGGKTGIDLRAGKNILGSFYQPKGVFIDLDFINTLPAREFNNGMAEVIKYGIIDDEELFRQLEEEISALQDREPGFLERIISISCRIKKGIIEIDETEKGLRRILNFGHTIGHAVEAESGFAIAHGEAVSIGMAVSARISEKMKYLSPEDRARIESLIASAGLPCRIPDSITTEGILSRIRVDKKKEGDNLHFVLIKKIGMPFINGSVSEPALRDVIEELRK